MTKFAAIVVGAVVALGGSSSPAFAGTLSVTPSVTGHGTVADARLPYTCANPTTSDNTTLACSASGGFVPACDMKFCAEVGPSLDLTATPAPGWRFVGWSGTRPTTCTTAVECDMSVSAVSLISVAYTPVAIFHEIVDVSLTATPPALTDSRSATISYVSPNGVGAHCTIDGATFICPLDPGTHLGSLPLTGLADGPHTVSVTTTSASGNSSDTAASVSWTVDTVAPVTALDAGPAQGSPVPVGPVSFAFSSSEDGSFQCSVDGADFNACASPLALPALAVGAHSLRVRSIDAAGNVGDVIERDWTVAAAAPLATPKAKLTPIVVTLAYNYRASRAATSFSKLEVRSVPRGALVVAKCPHGCAKTSLSQTARDSTVSLRGLVSHRVKAGSRITVTVSKAGSISAVKVLTVRALKAPSIATSCLAPGAKTPSRC